MLLKNNSGVFSDNENSSGDGPGQPGQGTQAGGGGWEVLGDESWDDLRGAVEEFHVS